MAADAPVIEADAEVLPDEPSPASRALATLGPRPTGLLRPVAPPAEIMQVQEETRALIEQALKPERDFGTIPGTKKPTLLKPGAERINAAFACIARYRIVEKEIDHDRKNEYLDKAGVPRESFGLYRYVLACELVHRDSGTVIGEGVGSCSTMESKYISRPRDCENTALKMAKKRAYVDATLTTFGLSDQFTQDVEDQDHEEKPFSLDQPVGFGKHKDRTWLQLLSEERQYVEWAVKNMERLSFDAKKELSAALNPPPATAAPTMHLEDMLNRCVNQGLVGENVERAVREVIERGDAGIVERWTKSLEAKLDEAKQEASGANGRREKQPA